MSGTSAPKASWGVSTVSALATLYVAIVFVICPFVRLTGLSPFGGPSGPSLTNPLPGGSGGGTSGGSTGGTSGASPSPSPSASTDPRIEYFNKAANTTNGKQLQEKGYEPAAVYELAPAAGAPGSNGQIATWLDGFTGRTGTYVMFRNRDNVNLVSTPQPGIKPDRVLLANTNASNDGDLVAYAQDFADGRGTICYADKADADKFDLSDPNNWYQLNKLSMVRGAPVGNATRVTVTSTDLDSPVATGVEVECMAYTPENEEISAS